MTYEEAVSRGYGGPPPTRRKRYACSDMMCGATDCETCHGPGLCAYGEPGDYSNAERKWLADVGYDYYCDHYSGAGGEWFQDISKKRRTARRDHADGKVMAGQMYWETVTRYIDDETGRSRHKRTKRVVKS